jgi:hypothetical protein
VALVARLKKFGLEGLIFFLRWHLANWVEWWDRSLPTAWG